MATWPTLGSSNWSTPLKTYIDDTKLGFCVEVSGSYPGRPATAAPVVFIGVDQPTGGGTTAGGAGSVDNYDFWFQLS